ncbi:MAG TPA: peptidylprolyl isomerase [Rickettsiales bacterium]|nr:peptidylprolyl isomerase [Rickettsiales bacterium]
MINGYGKKKKMKKIFAIIAMAAIVSYIVVVFLNKSPSEDRAVAKVGNKKIYKSEISAKISEIFAANGSDIGNVLKIENMPAEVIETFSREIYLEKKLVKKAKQVRLNKNPEIRSRLEHEESKILIDAYLNYIIEKNVNDVAIKEKYAELMGNLEGKKEYELSHIVVADEKEALVVYQSYSETSVNQKPKKFVELAKKYSIDKESANKKGDLGYILEDNIIKEIAEIVLKMTKGEYSKPIKTEFGWHIVKIDNIRDAKVFPFEEVKDDIREQMIKEKTKEIYDEIFNDVEVKILIDLNKKEEPKTSQQNEETK